MSRRILNATIIFIFLIVLVIGATGTVLYYQLRTDRVSSTVDAGRPLAILLTVHDGETPLMSSVIFFDPTTAQAGILDVPGNIGTLIRTQSRVDAIQSVYDPRNPSAFLQLTAELMGTDIPFWITLSHAQLVGFVDLLGGLDILVINDYPVLLPMGNVRLDGAKAVEYLSFVDPDESVLEEVDRRQGFVHAFLRAVAAGERVLNHPDVRRLRRSLLQTNLDDRALNALFRELARVDVETIVRRRVQGNTRQVDVSGVSKTLLFPHFEGQWLKQTVTQILQSLASPVEVGLESVAVSVEILNGTTSAGIARRTAQMYEQYGFAVHRVGNAENNQVEYTMVIDRRGVGVFAERVAQIIGARRIVTDVLIDAEVDVTVILGRDFDGNTVRSGSQ